ncbi:ubiquitin-associated and SH3 domain-containing protein B-like [Clavelina lepadiformis]|uniref:ubiquitin-associated and SH3 domain-containing protein B-like n=1 Tax=Clavelina lepadiformis TaxID=159417 RepID=UPI004043602F
MAKEDQGLFLQQNAADTLLRNTSSLQVLLSMGFPKDRAHKALAATGDAGVQVACDWIFAHVKDPTLDQVTPREFILYACPMGPFGLQLEEFWQQSLVACGRNGVHTSFPHVTLCSFFKCKDENVSKLVRAVTTACNRVCADETPSKFDVEYFAADNYVGLFLERSAANFLRKLSNAFAEEAQKIADTKVESHSNKQLHITLAYKFPANHFNKLQSLAKKLDLKKASTWEIRLYSKDPKFGDCEILRVLYPYTPTSESHLQLINGDCIFVGPEDVSDKTGFEGWFYGTSWMTGCSGFFPVSHTEKSTDTDTWTVHKKYSLASKANETDNDQRLSRRYSRGADEFHTSGYSSSRGLLNTDIDTLLENSATANASSSDAQRTTPSLPSNQNSKSGEEPPPRPPKDVYAQVQKPKGAVAVPPPVTPRARRIYIFRHAERVDVTFGKQWIKLSFDEQGKYHRKNLNMPKKLPGRCGGPSDFNHDSPITEMGLHQAFLTGQALKLIGVQISHAFSSPALRCLQTASSILKGLECDTKCSINTDYALYEWMKWSPATLPKFMDVNYLTKFGVNVAKSYQTKVKPKDLSANERCSEYFQRCHKFLSSVLKETSGDILITAHAGSLDGLSRQIQGLSPRPMPEFVNIVTKVPYCGAIVLEERADVGIWELIEPPFPTLTHAPNPHFDWKMLQD